MAKLTATLSGSFVMTDIPSRWREIELDRSGGKGRPRALVTIRQGISGLAFQYLNAVPLPAALELRQQGDSTECEVPPSGVALLGSG